MPEESIDVSGGAPSAPAAASPAAAPSSGVDSGATAASATEAGISPTPELVPQDDSDLEAGNPLAYKQGLLSLRSGYRDLQSRYSDLQSQSETYQQVMQKVEELGGIDTAGIAVDLVQQLFSPRVDQFGQMITDPQTGLPETDTTEFVRSIVSQNWNTALNLVENLLSVPMRNGETILDGVVRNVLGLDPQRLELYRSVRSPEEAARAGLLDVDPIELEDLPAEYHDTYRRMNAAQREAVQDPGLSDPTRVQLLQTAYQQQQFDAYFQQQQQYQQQQQVEAQQQWEAQIEQYAGQAADSLWNTHASALQNEVAKVQWTTDPSQNAMLSDMVLTGVEYWVRSDPTTQPLLQQAYALAQEAVRREAYGNKFEANQARVHAQRAASRLVGMAQHRLSATIQALQSMRGVAQAAQAPGNGQRPVIPARGQIDSQGAWSRPDGVKLLSNEYFDALIGEKAR